MKKIITYMLALVIMLTVCLPSAMASDLESTIDSKSSLDEVITYNDRIEKEMSDINDVLAKNHSKEIDILTTKIAGNNNIIDSILAKEIFQLSDKIRKESLQEEIKIASKYGYILIEDNETSASTRSVSSDLTWTSEVTMYHPETNTYRYTVDWDLGATDSLHDTYDVAGVGITNPDNFGFAGTYGKTYSIYGETCYVDNYGNSSGTQPDTMTKRAEDRNGVSFNVNDRSLMYDGLIMCSSGRITVYIKKKPTSTGRQSNKFITSYNHNYKTYEWQTTAAISFVGFNPSASMVITYTNVNKQWQRASGGKTIYA